MHNFVKVMLVIPALFLLFSCSDSVGVSFDESVYETDKISVNAILPQVECPQNPSFADSVNGEIRQIVSALSEDVAKKASEREKKAKLEITSNVTYNDSRLVSILLECEADTGGAHPEKFRICRTYDFVGARRVLLEDVFTDEEWKKAVDAEMERRAKEEDEYKGLWEIPSTKLLKNENFYFKDNGEIVFFFPPYDLSYYRRGFVEFEFTKEEMSGFIKPELGI